MTNTNTSGTGTATDPGRAPYKKNAQIIYPGIRNYLNSNGMRSSNLARSMKEDGQTVSKFLSGKRKMARISFIKNMLKCTGLTFEAAFGENGDTTD